MRANKRKSRKAIDRRVISAGLKLVLTPERLLALSRTPEPTRAFREAFLRDAGASERDEDESEPDAPASASVFVDPLDDNTGFSFCTEFSRVAAS